MDALRTLLEDNSDAFVQFAGYLAVSGAAFVVDFSAYWVLLKFAKFAFVAAAGGYVFGVLCHYALSSRIVFRTRFAQRGLKHEAPAVAKFFAAGATGLLVTAAVVGLLADVMGVHPLIAKLVAAGCSFGIVFMSLRLFVFNEPVKALSQPA